MKSSVYEIRRADRCFNSYFLPNELINARLLSHSVHFPTFKHKTESSRAALAGFDSTYRDALAGLVRVNLSFAYPVPTHDRIRAEMRGGKAFTISNTYEARM